MCRRKNGRSLTANSDTPFTPGIKVRSVSVRQCGLCRSPRIQPHRQLHNSVSMEPLMPVMHILQQCVCVRLLNVCIANEKMNEVVTRSFICMLFLVFLFPVEPLHECSRCTRCLLGFQVRLLFTAMINIVLLATIHIFFTVSTPPPEDVLHKHVRCYVFNNTKLQINQS